MKNIILIICLAFFNLQAFTQKPSVMKFNAGIVTTRLKESKEFYTKNLNFKVAFENEFYLLLESSGGDRLSFLIPEHPSQQPIFHKSFGGKGMYLTIEVDDVDSEYKRIKALGVKIIVEIRDEPWGDRHFAFYDPNGIGIDVVTNKTQ